jgi:hypothetical protein
MCDAHSDLGLHSRQQLALDCSTHDNHAPLCPIPASHSFMVVIPLRTPCQSQAQCHSCAVTRA